MYRSNSQWLDNLSSKCLRGTFYTIREYNSTFYVGMVQGVSNSQYIDMKTKSRKALKTTKTKLGRLNTNYSYTKLTWKNLACQWELKWQSKTSILSSYFSSSSSSSSSSSYSSLPAVTDEQQLAIELIPRWTYCKLTELLSLIGLKLPWASVTHYGYSVCPDMLLRARLHFTMTLMTDSFLPIVHSMSVQ